MKINRIDQIAKPRFRIAVHVLAWLAHNGGVVSSASIACLVDSHATFLRRVLACLTRSGFVEAKAGREGGYLLKVSETQLTLADIYSAIQDDRECAETEEIDCGEAGRQLDRNLQNIMLGGEQQLIEWLRRYSLSDVMAGIEFPASHEQ